MPMNATRFQEITKRYPNLRLALLGDFCLDRYLEIDPARKEVSLETGLPVYNVTHVRSQPGGAGTILNNLVALGIGTIYPIGFAGEDGEGFELARALRQLPGVRLEGFIQTPQRRTFTYCKPLVLAPGKPPVELNRLDSKNWSPTPVELQDDLAKRLLAVARSVDAIIVLDQVDVQDTGVVAQHLLQALGKLANEQPDLLILADSRRGLRGFPPVVFKMNAAELATLRATRGDLSLDETKASAAGLARQNRRAVFISLAERGLLGATPDGKVEHVPALPLRGEIDIVGAGDAVSANLTSALAAGATLREAVELANAAASVVVHKLGTTGTASVSELAALLL
jgi:rfaE bifunctional protein kinase chain/domain